MASLRYERFPGDHGSIQRYIEKGVEPGSFMVSLLSNDLKETCARADDFNRYQIWQIVHWLWNEAPATCWGSREKYREWVRSGGLKGQGMTADDVREASGAPRRDPPAADPD